MQINITKTTETEVDSSNRIIVSDSWHVRCWDISYRIQCEQWYFEECDFYVTLHDMEQEFTGRWYPQKFWIYGKYASCKIDAVSKDRAKRVKERIEARIKILVRLRDFTEED